MRLDVAWKDIFNAPAAKSINPTQHETGSTQCFYSTGQRPQGRADLREGPISHYFYEGGLSHSARAGRFVPSPGDPAERFVLSPGEASDQIEKMAEAGIAATEPVYARRLRPRGWNSQSGGLRLQDYIAPAPA